MEQIYHWFEYRKNNWWSFLWHLIKLSLKMVGWKEQEPDCNLFWYELKPALLISHTLVDPLI